MIHAKEKQLLNLLMNRVERISADSVSAHRASGVRAAILRMLDQIEDGQSINQSELMRLTEQGFHILGQAAREKSGKTLHG